MRAACVADQVAASWIRTCKFHAKKFLGRGARSITDRRPCSNFGSTPAAVDVNGDQMATWTYRRSTFVTNETSALASKPLLLFRKNGPVVFTKKYVKHTLFSKKEYSEAKKTYKALSNDTYIFALFFRWLIFTISRKLGLENRLLKILTARDV